MLTDINFQQGELQDFIVEIPVGLLNAPLDVLFEPVGQAFILEVPMGGGNIFIMSE